MTARWRSSERAVRMRRRLRAWLPGAVALGAGVLAWEIVGRSADVSYLPPFSAVVGRLAEMIADGALLQHAASSLTSLAIGYAIAVVAGIAIGALMGASRRIEALLDIWVYALLAAPSIVFAPIFFTIFGFGRETIVAIVVLYSIFVIIIDTMAGVHAVANDLREMAQSFGASRPRLVLRVLLPGAMPLVFAGLRLGAGRAVKGMVNGEMFVAVVGIGGLLIRAGQQFDAESVLAILLFVVVIAFAVVWLVTAIERRTLRWLPTTSR
jgi:ABC-type nitrate/sulfonate/bicarbonate transport system permease component